MVASDIPVHRELLGDGPWLAPARSIHALSQAIATTLRDADRIAADAAGAPRRYLRSVARPERGMRRRSNRSVAGAQPQRPARPAGSGLPRIALVSPLPPQRSGVADYTALYVPSRGPLLDGRAVQFRITGRGRKRPCAAHLICPVPRPSGSTLSWQSVGNSFFHLPMLDLITTFGGACISHDDRMFEEYLLRSGESSGLPPPCSRRRRERLMSPSSSRLLPILTPCPRAATASSLSAASPLIVHSTALRKRIHAETGIEPALVPFVPHNLPTTRINIQIRAAARKALGLRDDVAHLATFGYVDRRTKRTDTAVMCTSWLRDWGRPVHLHVVGGVPSSEHESLRALIQELDLDDLVTFTGRVERSGSTRTCTASTPQYSFVRVGSSASADHWPIASRTACPTVDHFGASRGARGTRLRHERRFAHLRTSRSRSGREAPRRQSEQSSPKWNGSGTRTSNRDPAMATPDGCSGHSGWSSHETPPYRRYAVCELARHDRSPADDVPHRIALDGSQA